MAVAVSVSFSSGDGSATADLPLGGASRRVKVAEHNEALPVDRVFLHYQHAHNALHWERSPPTGGPVIADANAPVDRYTVGVEKTFCDGGWSVELRMPFSTADVPPVPGLELAGGNVGNLAVILKQRVYENELGAVAAGLAIDTPTFPKTPFHDMVRARLTAVSIKLPPAFAYSSKIPRLSSTDAPQRQSCPNVIVPSASSETKRPLCPNLL